MRQLMYWLNKHLVVGMFDVVVSMSTAEVKKPDMDSDGAAMAGLVE